MDFINKKDSNIILSPNPASTPDPRGIGHVYYDYMLKHGNKIAQTDISTNRQESFKTLLRRCVRTAFAMKSKGIKPGDFISICTLTDFDTCLPYIASFFIGAITASVDPDMSVTEIVYLLKQVLPKMIFVSEEAVSLIEEVIQELGIDITIVVFGKTEIYTPFSEFLKTFPNEDEFKLTEIDNLHETALVIFSSGTTGRPKGIRHTHFSILSNDIIFNYGSEFTMVAFCTLYWSVLHMFLHTSLVNGFERLIIRQFDADNPWDIFKFKIGVTILTPFSCLAFTKHERPDHVNLDNLTLLCVSSYSITKENLLKLKTCLPKTIVLNTYGQSEVFRTLFDFPQTIEGQQLMKKYPNSVGCPVVGVNYKVIDIETEEVLGPNKQGELRIKSNCQTVGYYNQDSKDLFDTDGWLKTGDLVHYNDEKCFFINDRIKETFKYKGNHISPMEIETVVLTHPAVKHAVVLGLPHKTESNHPLAIVVLNEDRNDVTADEIVKYVDGRIEDKNRLRGGVKFVKSIPMTVSNKYSRFKLREMFVNNQI